MLWRRLFSSASAAAQAVSGGERSTLKAPLSRKTYLVDKYTELFRSNSVVLALHNSTLLKKEDQQLRHDIAKAGGKLTIVRSNLAAVALRGLDHEDPASKSAHEQFHRHRHPLSQLLNGPSAVITIPDLDPSVVNKIVTLVDKSKNKLILLGGMVDGAHGKVLDRMGIDKVKTLPSIDELRAQLAGVLTVLGGAGLVQTLESSSKMLYLTLDQHRKNQAGELGEENEK